VVSPGCDDVTLENALSGQENGICGAGIRGGLLLLTGLHTRWVSLTVDVLDSEPVLGAEWEEVVEVPFRYLSPGVSLENWDGDKICDIPLTSPPYTVRYCAKHSGSGEDRECEAEETPIESYSLEFWRAAERPDAVLKQTRELAAYWHRYAKELHP
jgi:hypothetical protein